MMCRQKESEVTFLDSISYTQTSFWKEKKEAVGPPSFFKICLICADRRNESMSASLQTNTEIKKKSLSFTHQIASKISSELNEFENWLSKNVGKKSEGKIMVKNPRTKRSFRKEVISYDSMICNVCNVEQGKKKKRNMLFLSL